jgi:hypothetical protein
MERTVARLADDNASVLANRHLSEHGLESRERPKLRAAPGDLSQVRRAEGGIEDVLIPTPAIEGLDMLVEARCKRDALRHEAA